MVFSYRTRRFFSRLLRFVLILALVALAVLACWMLWLQRYILYTPDGVKLDFSLEQDWGSGVEAGTLGSLPSVFIQFGDLPEESTAPVELPEMEKIAGYYVSTDQLMTDIYGTLEKIQALPAGSAVLLEVKDGWGDFYYSTTVGNISGEFNMDVMDAFFDTVNSLDLHTIARVSALRDYEFGLHNTSCGLWHPGGYLWVDGSHCYWLDPTKDGTLTYLIRITQELQSLGFDEVVFQDFYVPVSENILFSEDRNAALEAAAAKLVASCASPSFIVSFLVENTSFAIPAENCRLYLTGVEAEAVAELAANYGVADPAKQLLFFTESGDTRYEECCVLRPIDTAW